MDATALVAALVQALAWPVAATVAVLLLRKPIAQMVTALRKVKYGDVEADFYTALPGAPQPGPQVQLPQVTSVAPPVPSTGASSQAPTPAEPRRPRVSAELAQYVEVAPRAALIEAWIRVSGAAVDAVRRAGAELAPQAQFAPAIIESELLNRGVLTQQQIAVLGQLRRQRDTAAHAPTQPPPGVVLQYIGLADSLHAVLQQHKKGA